MRRLAIVQHVVSAGGVERLVNALVKALAELPAAGDWDITMLTVASNSAGVSTNAERTFPDSVEVRPLGPAPAHRGLDRLLGGKRVMGIPGSGRLVRSVGKALEEARSRWFEGGLSPLRRELEHVLRRGDFDVAYFPYPYLIRPPKIDLPVVGTFHDFNYRHTKSFDASIRARLERQMPAWLSRSDRIVVSTQTVMTELSQFYPGFESKTRLVRPSFPVPQPDPSPAQLEQFRRERALPPTFILTTGWVVPHKNQAVVFEAVANMRSKGARMSIVLVGPNSHELAPDAPKRGPYVDHVIGVAAGGGLVHGRDYLALGFVSDFELECLFRLAKAVIIPATYEAGSFTGVEAMRAGCPVVFSRTPANLEQAGLVENNAWLFEPTDAISLVRRLEEIVGDPQGTAETCERARVRVTQDLSWERAASEYLSVFQEAVLGDPSE